MSVALPMTVDVVQSNERSSMVCNKSQCLSTDGWYGNPISATEVSCVTTIVSSITKEVSSGGEDWEVAGFVVEQEIKKTAKTVRSNNEYFSIIETGN